MTGLTKMNIGIALSVIGFAITFTWDIGFLFMIPLVLAGGWMIGGGLSRYQREQENKR